MNLTLSGNNKEIGQLRERKKILDIEVNKAIV